MLARLRFLKQNFFRFVALLEVRWTHSHDGISREAFPGNSWRAQDNRLNGNNPRGRVFP